MLIPPLARAVRRPGLRSLQAYPLSSHITRVFATGPIHRKDAHGQRPPSGSKIALAETKNAAEKSTTKPAKANPLLAEQVVSNKEQRKADWAIMKEMSRYLWPKDNLGTRFRVGLSVGLLVGAKLLNVQIPFYFKSIVDSMNIDFMAVGGTAWTVAGSMIVACKLFSGFPVAVTERLRWCYPHRCHSVPGAP
jgi:ATP-binding cassette, subfamily B (MDR/TAP), member 7